MVLPAATGPKIQSQVPGVLDTDPKEVPGKSMKDVQLGKRKYWC